MSCLKLGSKSEAFQREGQKWVCTTGLPTDIVIEVGDMSFLLHKFPLLTKSGILKKRIGELSSEDGTGSVLQLHDIPGGAKSFEVIAKFCYGIKLELNPLNVVSIRCAAEHLHMTEEYGEGNLISQTESFLNDVFSNWNDTLKVLESCEEVISQAEELHLVSRCINSLAAKACADPSLWPISGSSSLMSPGGSILWNGIGNGSKPRPLEPGWWYEDVSFLSLSLYKRLIIAIETRGTNPENIAGSLMFYAKRYLPWLGRDSSFLERTNRTMPNVFVSVPSENDQKMLLEELVNLLPNRKGVTSAKFLFGLLRTAIILHASPSCRENLEKRAGAQLNHASLEDLLIPNSGYSVETLYDIDCVHRILDHFLLMDQTHIESSGITEEGQIVGSPSLTPITMVAKLIDCYLAEVAPDSNLKCPKFQSIASAIPDYARHLDDGIYRAIDIYLKAHPWVTDSEREQLCRLMNCQKLSLEACTHAAKNERLPLRVVVQVLFFEQLKLRTTIAGWFLVNENLEDTQNPHRNSNHGQVKNGYEIREIQADGADDCDISGKVLELERECMSIKRDIEKLGKKNNQNFFSKTFGFKFKIPNLDCKRRG